MNRDEKRFLMQQMDSIQVQITSFSKNIQDQWNLREKHYTERKEVNDKRLDAINDSIKLLFTKNDKLSSIVQNATNEIRNRPCKVHDVEFIALKKDITRLFGWLGGICVWIIGITGIMLKKVLSS